MASASHWRVTSRSASFSWGRTLLAMLVAAAVALSFFHDRLLAADSDNAPPGVAAVLIAATDTSAHHAPAQQAPAHGDHCLTHLNVTATQERVSIPIAFAGSAYFVRDETVPAAMGGLAPFKPPCA
jgi:hypothetical protein